MSTMLEDFTAEAIKKYREPSRRGTAKGEKIGLSRVKFHAALMSLTNDPVSEQAEALKISYSVLRKWRSQDEFKKIAAGHVENFGNRILDFLRDHEFDQKLFSDAARYSNEVIKFVRDRSFPKDLKDKVASDLFYRCRSLFAVAAATLELPKDEFSEFKSGLGPEARLTMARSYLQRIRAVLEKPIPTYAERKSALMLTEAVFRMITD